MVFSFSCYNAVVHNKAMLLTKSVLFRSNKPAPLHSDKSESKIRLMEHISRGLLFSFTLYWGIKMGQYGLNGSKLSHISWTLPPLVCPFEDDCRGCDWWLVMHGIGWVLLLFLQMARAANFTKEALALIPAFKSLLVSVCNVCVFSLVEVLL